MKGRWLWIPRLLAAGVLLPMGYQKLVRGEMSRILFDTLGMEPHGRVAIGLVEILAVLLLRRRELPIIGSTLDGEGKAWLP